MDLNLDINSEKILRDASAYASERIRQITQRLINSHFEDGRQSTSSPGIGYLMIQKAIDERLLSDDMEKVIERIVEEHFERKLSDAVEVALERKVRKIASLKTGADKHDVY